MSEQPKDLLQAASLHQIEICIAQNQPFCAGRLKIDFNPGMGSLSFAIENDAVAEFAVAHALPKSNAEFVTGLRRTS